MEYLLQVKELQTTFHTENAVIRAVDGVSFGLRPGEVLGLVGESGCGKSVVSLSIMRLVLYPPGKIEGGRVIFDGKDLLSLSEREMHLISPLPSLSSFPDLCFVLAECAVQSRGFCPWAPEELVLLCQRL